MVPRRPLVAIAGGIGFLLVLVGLTVMVGWLRHWPWAVKLGSDRLLIVFATGVNLTLLGAGLAALLVGTVRPNVRWADPVARGLGGVVAVLSTLRLAEMLEGVDAYTFVFDPYVPEVVQSRLSDDLASIAIDLENGLRHFRAGDVDEALWWWQFSYVASWGNEASGVLRALQSVVTHDRLDSDVTAEAEALARASEVLGD